MYIKNGFVPIRPNTYLLKTDIDENDKVTQHRYINEEEIQTVGTKIKISFQRARWFNEKMFNWYGVKKETSKAKVYSGLSFDELIE